MKANLLANNFAFILIYSGGGMREGIKEKYPRGIHIDDRRGSTGCPNLFVCLRFPLTPKNSGRVCGYLFKYFFYILCWLYIHVLMPLIVSVRAIKRPFTRFIIVSHLRNRH